MLIDYVRRAKSLIFQHSLNLATWRDPPAVGRGVGIGDYLAPRELFQLLSSVRAQVPRNHQLVMDSLPQQIFDEIIDHLPPSTFQPPFLFSCCETAAEKKPTTRSR